MAATSQEIAQRALFLLAAGDADSPWFALEVEANLAISQAMQELGLAIADHPTRYGLLQQDYTVTLDGVTGAADLTMVTGVITGLADIIWEKVKEGRVKDATSTPLHFIPDVFEFEGDVLLGLNYWTTYQSKIYTRGSEGGSYESDKGTIAAAGNITVTASYYPTIGNAASLPLELESDAVRILAKTLAAKFTGLPPTAKDN